MNSTKPKDGKDAVNAMGVMKQSVPFAPIKRATSVATSMAATLQKRGVRCMIKVGRIGVCMSGLNMAMEGYMVSIPVGMVDQGSFMRIRMDKAFRESIIGESLDDVKVEHRIARDGDGTVGALEAKSLGAMNAVVIAVDAVQAQRLMGEKKEAGVRLKATRTGMDLQSRVMTGRVTRELLMETCCSIPHMPVHLAVPS